MHAPGFLFKTGRLSPLNLFMRSPRLKSTVKICDSVCGSPHKDTQSMCLKIWEVVLQRSESPGILQVPWPGSLKAPSVESKSTLYTTAHYGTLLHTTASVSGDVVWQRQNGHVMSCVTYMSNVNRCINTCNILLLPPVCIPCSFQLYPQIGEVGCTKFAESESALYTRACVCVCKHKKRKAVGLAIAARFIRFYTSKIWLLRTSWTVLNSSFPLVLNSLMSIDVNSQLRPQVPWQQVWVQCFKSSTVSKCVEQVRYDAHGLSFG